MILYVDADACPKAVKEVLFRVAERRRLPTVLVANQRIWFPPENPFVSGIQVPGGLDEADERIVELTEPGDLCITSDIPLASGVIDKGGFVMSPRGQLLTVANIGERRAVRDIMADIRGTGVETGGPPAFGPKDREHFVNQLDRFLTKHHRPASDAASPTSRSPTSPPA